MGWEGEGTEQLFSCGGCFLNAYIFSHLILKGNIMLTFPTLF